MSQIENLIPRIPVRIVGTRPARPDPRVVQKDGSDWLFIRKEKPWPGLVGEEEFDGAEMFFDLMNIKTPEDGKAFLEKYGPIWLGAWIEGHPLHSEYQGEYPDWSLEQARQAVVEQDIVKFSELLHLQKAIAKAAQHPLRKWEALCSRTKDSYERLVFGTGVMFRLDVSGDTMEGVCEEDDIIHVPLSFLFVHKAAGAEYRNCARGKCSRLFLVESQTSKIYCSPECAHGAAVEAYRARKRKKEGR
jgi:hypothetical protein